MSIQSLTLRFTNPAQQLVGTQEIPLASIQQPGSKSVAITNAGILAAFNANPDGTIFTPSIAANYGNDESGNPITRVTSPASNIPSFIPRVISVVSIINKTTTDTSFNLSSFITTISTGALSYSSSNPSVASVNSSGQVTLLTEGIITITINVTATSEHMAGTASTTLNVITPPPPITRAANGVTIQYTGSAQEVINAYNSSTPKPLFIQANPRGTFLSGVPQPEWFAVVNNSSKAQITSYAKNETTGISYFTTSGQLVPFNNIVTTHMTDMSFMFESASVFNQNIGSWDTAKVTNMNTMFANALEFNNDESPTIDSWNTSEVRNMYAMFYNTRAFNQPIGSWNTENVENMGRMFFYALAFNQNIGAWNTALVTNMDRVFWNAQAFNQNISGWNVALTTARPSLSRTNFATGSLLALAENSAKLPLFQS